MVGLVSLLMVIVYSIVRLIVALDITYISKIAISQLFRITLVSNNSVCCNGNVYLTKTIS